LCGTNQEGEASGRSDEFGPGGQRRFDALDGPHRDEVERGRRESFCAHVLYIDVRQCNGARQFAEKRGFLVVGLDEGEGDFRGPEFKRDAGESGAGTHIGNVEAVPVD